MALMELRPAIRSARFIKEYSNVVNPRLAGTNGSVLDQIITNGEIAAGSLASKNRQWVDEKINYVIEYLKTDPELADCGESGLYSLVESSYFRGLSLFLKNQYRLFRKEEPKLVDNLFSQEYLAQQSVVYLFDFYRIFRNAERTETPPSVALQAATLAYRHTPELLKELRDAFPNIRPSGIYQALLGAPVNPREWLYDAELKISEMKQKYPDFEESLILRAVFSNPTNYDSVLASFSRRVDELKCEFPDLPHYVYSGAVLYHAANSRNHVKSYIKAISEFKLEFPNLPDFVLSRAASDYPKNAREYLRGIVERKPILEEKYPDLPSYAIESALVRRPLMTEKYLDKVRIVRKNLSDKYPDLPSSLLLHLALDHKDAAQMLENALELLPQYVDRFPQFARYDILYILLNNSKAEEFLINNSKKFDEYMRQHPEESPSLVSYAYSSQSDPETFICDTNERLMKLQVEFPNVARSSLMYVATYHPEDSLNFARSQINKAPKYNELYPTVSHERIINALLGRPQNPDKYIQKVINE